MGYIRFRSILMLHKVLEKLHPTVLSIVEEHLPHLDLSKVTLIREGRNPYGGYNSDAARLEFTTDLSYNKDIGESMVVTSWIQECLLHIQYLTTSMVTPKQYVELREHSVLRLHVVFVAMGVITKSEIPESSIKNKVPEEEQEPVDLEEEVTYDMYAISKEPEGGSYTVGPCSLEDCQNNGESYGHYIFKLDPKEDDVLASKWDQDLESWVDV